MTNPLKWGILSTGGIADQFTRDVLRLPDHRVVAVGSRELSRANDLDRKSTRLNSSH